MAETPPTLPRLKRAADAAVKARGAAEKKLAERDDLCLALADGGIGYADLAKAMGISPDGVTYVLRKQRQARAIADAAAHQSGT